MSCLTSSDTVCSCLLVNNVSIFLFMYEYVLVFLRHIQVEFLYF